MLASASTVSGHRLLVVAVSKQPGFAHTVASALNDLTTGSDRMLHTDDADQPQATGAYPPRSA
jgi:hypothetical protein